SRRGTEQFISSIRREITTQLAALGIATKRDLAALERRLRGKSAPPEAAPAKKTAPAKKAAASKKASPAKKSAATTKSTSAKKTTVKKTTTKKTAPSKSSAAKKAPGQS
ncbi:MAG TPA: hypothetical protein VMO88_05050, partial [Acidimicrobiales bacterium]|nr:hypothetical protein [Acidimicrobiales bacterium]